LEGWQVDGLEGLIDEGMHVNVPDTSPPEKNGLYLHHPDALPKVPRTTNAIERLA
jgi:hypothetical protein